MALKTGEQYLESLKKLRPDVHMFGEKVEKPWEHPIIKPSQNSVALTYDLAHDPEYEDLMTATSQLTGEKVNRFTHLYENKEDLVRKIRMLRLLGQKTATCFQRCATSDLINPLHVVTYEIDRNLGTRYHQRFLEFVKYVQENDLAVGAAVTDVKGDRSLRPSQQADPDLYLHVVEERSDGIVVRGAKAHQTGAINFHWTVVAPTRAMLEEDRDYAVCFAIPIDAPGLINIYGRQFSDTRKLEEAAIDVGNRRFGGQETLMIFDDVFVPWEMVFMYKEHQFAGMLGEIFGSHHRHSYAGCKVGVSDVLIGAAAALADYHGIANASHVRSKITEMVQLTETIYGCGLASAHEAQRMPSGIYLNDFLLGNVCKLNAGRFTYQIGQLAIDMAGAILGTLPSEKDFRNPETGKYLEKYLKGAADVPTEHKFRILRLVENLMFGTGGVGYIVEAVHGAGSPEAQKLMIYRLANLEHKKKLAKAIAEIEEIG